MRVKEETGTENQHLVHIIAPKEAIQGENIIFRGEGHDEQWRWEFGETGMIDSREKTALYAYAEPDIIMSNKIETLAKIQEVGIVAVVRATSIEQAEKITDACIAGGVAAIELTFTVPHADKLIEAMRAKYSSGEIIIGAGTVMDAATARIAILAGAEYIVSPYFDPETVKTCNRYGIPSMPGIYTPTEAVHAMECGADVLKVFPGDIATPSFIKDIHGPIPNAVMMPSGGVDVDNVKDWIKAGAVAVGAGSSLIKGAKTGDYDLITETGKLFVERIKEARAEMKK